MPKPYETPEELSCQLNRLNDELRVIRDVLDDIRSDLSWGIQNGRIILSLTELDRFEHVADATLGGDVVELTLRLQMSLATTRTDIADAVDRQRSCSITASESERSMPESIATIEDRLSHAQNDPQRTKQRQRTLFHSNLTDDPANSLPAITLFEVGEVVELLYDRPGQTVEIIDLDDARNSATIKLINPNITKMVSQDAIKKTSPQRKRLAPQNET